MKSFLLILAMTTGFIAVVEAQIGPSTTTPPYLVPTASGVEFTSILTVGDRVKLRHKGNETYRMVGIPDGLGAYDNGDGTFTVLMNHELTITSGFVRDHGARGAFVSRWQIRKSDLKVLSGEDLIRRVYLWNGAEYVETPGVLFSRLCSADLPAKSAFFNAETGKGFDDGLIFLNGEESGSTGRAFAHVVQGVGNSASYELPLLGRFSWENAVACPFAQDKTIVAGLEDGNLGSSKVFFYIGEKQSAGSAVDLAGLTSGTNYQLRVAGVAIENSIPTGDQNPRAFSLEAGGGTGFNRVEDGAWDTQDQNVFYFVTTASFSTNSRLWKVAFSDVRFPEAGGTIEVVVDGAISGPKMMDNITVDGAGNVILQEDPGNQSYLARIWSYDPFFEATTELARFDPISFTAGASPPFITQDEESSGVIEVSDLFDGVGGYDTEFYRYFVLDAQIHRNISATEPELVEMGQLLLMKVIR